MTNLKTLRQLAEASKFVIFYEQVKNDKGVIRTPAIDELDSSYILHLLDMLEVAREALEFYAEERKYDPFWKVDEYGEIQTANGGQLFLMIDRGATARAALSKLKGE